MKKLAFAFAAFAVVSLAAPSAEAMNIGSLSRQHPMIAATEVASLAYPAVCEDLSCGVAGKSAADYSPVIHILFSSISGFLHDQIEFALQTSRKADVQLVASAN